MKMSATIELEFDWKDNPKRNGCCVNSGFGGLKKRHRANRERRAPENYQVRVYKVDYCKDSPRLTQLEAKGQTHAPC